MLAAFSAFTTRQTRRQTNILALLVEFEVCKNLKKFLRSAFALPKLLQYMVMH